MGRVTYVALAQFSASATDELSVRMSTLPIRSARLVASA